MMDNSGSSAIWRRIRVYLVGFIIGLLATYFIWGGRGCQSLTPGMLKLDQLATKDTIRYSDTALCQMKCQHISKDEVMESFTYGKVNTDKSQSFHVRHPLFNFDGKTKDGRVLNVVCMEIDSIARIIYVKDKAMKDSCKCP